MTAGSDRTPLLVVDDEPPIRRLLRTSLGAESFEVLEADTAEKAFATIEAKKPEIVILDLGLPDHDGLDVIRRIRRSGSKLPIVVLSSRGDERGKVEALELGADDYVTKPFGIAELVARIRTALRHRFQEQGGEPLFKSRAAPGGPCRRVVSVAGEEVKLYPRSMISSASWFCMPGRSSPTASSCSRSGGRPAMWNTCGFTCGSFGRRSRRTPRAGPHHDRNRVGYRLHAEG